MEINFGIHQDLWQDAWIAATSAVRARKRQIDLNVQERVQHLLAEHGPRSGKALSLRVYGTMIKGFSVINNDRAKVLHSDCERVVLLFASQPYSEHGLKLPAAKRQRVDAVTLDLARVKEAEAFDWTLGAPMEMLSLEVERLPEPPESSGWAMAMMPSLEEGLGTDAFPQAPAAPAAELPGPPRLPGVDLMEMPRVDEAQLDLPPAPQAPVPKRRRRMPIPGHLLGFDVDLQMPEAQVEAFRRCWEKHGKTIM